MQTSPAANLPPDTAATDAMFSRLQSRRYVVEYLARCEDVSPETAWSLIYELLLWIDPNNGCAHCGSHPAFDATPIYAQRFHRWLSEAIELPATALAQKLDQLFRYTLAESALVDSSISNWTRRTPAAAQPESADAPAIFYEQILCTLRPYLLVDPPSTALASLNGRLRDYWSQEKRRMEMRNDVFQFLVGKIICRASHLRLWIRTEVAPSEIPGFEPNRGNTKDPILDVLVEYPDHRQPAFIHTAWTLTPGREDQLWDDFKEYVRFDRDQRGFDHYLITNEFDPARLNAVCDRREANTFIFKHVVHINTDGVLAAYGPPLAALQGAEKGKAGGNSSMQRVRQQVEQSRLISLSKWLSALGANG